MNAAFSTSDRSMPSPIGISDFGFCHHPGKACLADSTLHPKASLALTMLASPQPIFKAQRLKKFKTSQ